ncbi:MAG: hypothetical protein WCC63_01710 [Candidatus Bathyarchaeia archaeon]
MILTILKYIGVAGTIIVGVVALVRPTAVIGFTGLQPLGGRGITEIRAVLGGLFIGLGAAPLLLRTPAAYQTLGIGYLATGVVRAISMLADKSVISSNTLSLAWEIIFGLALVL